MRNLRLAESSIKRSSTYVSALPRSTRSRANIDARPLAHSTTDSFTQWKRSSNDRSGLRRTTANHSVMLIVRFQELANIESILDVGRARNRKLSRRLLNSCVPGIQKDVRYSGQHTPLGMT